MKLPATNITSHDEAPKFETGIEMKSLMISDVESTDCSDSSSSDGSFDHSDTADTNEAMSHHAAALGTASQGQVAVNIFISFVGAGMLGMPYAFSRSGWLLGSLTLSIVSIANVYAMLLLVKARKHLERKGHNDIRTYGDLARVVIGTGGESIVNILVVISQIGFATAYLIFIAANINNIWHIDRFKTCLCFIPILSCLVQVREMKTLSPFSLIADVANLTGLSAVLLQDFESYVYHHESVAAVDFSNMVFVVGVSMYAFEGVALILPLESSCKDREGFPALLKKVIAGITLLMATFGTAGFVAFASSTCAPITLNLLGKFWATFVKMALSVALYLTFPIMMFPVNEAIEGCLSVKNNDSPPKPARFFRVLLVILSTTIAYSIPNFGEFLNLVGSSICMLLAFILPCSFHILVMRGEGLQKWELVVDVTLIVLGVVFGVLGTYDSVKSIFFDGDDESESCNV